MYKSVWLLQKFQYLGRNYWISWQHLFIIREKQSTIVVYLDFPTASDTVNHDILMSKLQHNGISSVGLSLIWVI